ncbi:MAG: diphosphate--fructose-6-phosphate 1-phosphotransferase [Phycisphaerales bacterium]|nr:diphosphate--fructose-6-phosphate 1-phosphotransferase [Phycisphaerales bacterium]
MAKNPPRTKPPRGNAVIGQSGGPTAVINQSLAGAVEALRDTLVRKDVVKRIFGMRHGVNGLVKDDLIDLTKVKGKALDRVARSPAAALGSSRDKPDRDYCNAILNACSARDIRYFFYIGGNDSSDTCRIVSELADEAGYDMRCFHIPKTVDNDLVGSDHTPGFPSAARFVATAFAADGLDNASLPGVKINVVMGRHAGFLTAASALARECFEPAKKKSGFEPGPHLIYLPEVPFDTDRFIAEVQEVYSRLGRCQVAVSEGVQDKDGTPIATRLAQGLDRDAHGNVQLSGVSVLGDALADLVKRNVKTSSGKQARVRADTFGYLQRCWPDPSPVDAAEARAAAEFAVACAARGFQSGSVAITRRKGKKYRAEYGRIDLRDVAAKTRHMPESFIKGTSNVTRAFSEYCRPLVGPLPRLARLGS